MTTAGLIAIKRGGKIVFCQQCNADAYPSSHGATIFGFLRAVDMDRFCRQVDKLSDLTDEENKRINTELFGTPHSRGGEQQRELCEMTHPEVFWNTGARALHMIYYGTLTKNPNEIRFAGNGLFCEWGWVIDLDNMRLEVYRGFVTWAVKRGISHGVFSHLRPAVRPPVDERDLRSLYLPIVLICSTTFELMREQSAYSFITWVQECADRLSAKVANAERRQERQQKKQTKLESGT